MPLALKRNSMANSPLPLDPALPRSKHRRSSFIVNNTDISPEQKLGKPIFAYFMTGFTRHSYKYLCVIGAVSISPCGQPRQLLSRSRLHSLSFLYRIGQNFFFFRQWFNAPGVTMRRTPRSRLRLIYHICDVYGKTYDLADMQQRSGLGPNQYTFPLTWVIREYRILLCYMGVSTKVYKGCRRPGGIRSPFIKQSILSLLLLWKAFICLSNLCTLFYTFRVQVYTSFLYLIPNR